MLLLSTMLKMSADLEYDFFFPKLLSASIYEHKQKESNLNSVVQNY